MTGAANVIRNAGDECVIQTCAEPPARTRSGERWILAATILGSSMAFIDGTVVNVALPVLQRDLHATAAELQWVVEAYSLFLSALILVGGALGDRLGRKRVFSAGIVLFTLASVVCGMAPNIAFLIGARAVQGVGGALLVPGSLAIISASFDTASRGRAIGTWAGFSTITTALGPVAGGWLVQNASWRWVFFINVPLAIATLWLTVAHVPESRDEQETGPLDWLGALLVTLGLGAIVYGLIEAGPLGLGDPVVIAALIVGVIALVLFVVQEARSGSPMVPLEIFRSRAFTGANLLTLLLYGGLGGSLYFVPFNLQQVQGYTPTAAGAALLPFTVVVFLTSRWTGGLVDRYGAKLPLIVGPCITACGFALFARIGIGGSYWTTFFPATVVMSAGMALVITPLSTAVMSALESRLSGVASGVNNAVSRAAGLLAIAVLGLVVAGVFASRLDSQLHALHVSRATRNAVYGQRQKLAGIIVPTNVPQAQQARLGHAVKESFVSGFQASMLVAAALAVASALFAAWLIPGKQPASDVAEAAAARPDPNLQSAR